LACELPNVDSIDDIRSVPSPPMSIINWLVTALQSHMQVKSVRCKSLSNERLVKKVWHSLLHLRSLWWLLARHSNSAKSANGT
jgi:hypothetical protein